VFMKKLLLTGIAALFLATGTVQHEAHALADGPACAMVRQTPDGFLNLRARCDWISSEQPSSAPSRTPPGGATPSAAANAGQKPRSANKKPVDAFFCLRGVR